jgi:hypothetical protein
MNKKKAEKKLNRFKTSDLSILLKESGAKIVPRSSKKSKIVQFLRTPLGKKLLILGATLTPTALGLVGGHKLYHTILRSKVKACPFRKEDNVTIDMNVLVVEHTKSDSTYFPPNQAIVLEVNLLTEKVKVKVGGKIKFYNCSDLRHTSEFLSTSDLHDNFSNDEKKIIKKL